MAAPVASLLVKISGDSSELRKELSATQRNIKSAFGNDAIKASERALKVTKWLAAGFVAVGAASVVMAAKVQQTRAALVTLTKSAEAADKLLGEIKTFAATTPFEFQGLAQAAQQMVAFNFEAKAVVPILRVVGDAVAGLGGNQENMNSIVRILGQIQTKGKVTAKEIMQLAQQGVNAWQYLADATGKSVAQVQKDVSKSGMSSAAAITAIVNGMNKQFAGGMETQSKTLMGIWSTVRENVTGVMRQIGASITEGFSLEKTFGEFSDWLSKFTVAVDQSGFKAAMKEMIPDSVIITAVGFAAVLTGRMIPALVLAAKAAMATNAALLTTQIMTGGVVLAIGFIASEVAGYTSVTKTAIEKTKEWFNTFKQNRQILKEMGLDELAKFMGDPNSGSIQDMLAAKRKEKGLDTATTTSKGETPAEKALRETEERAKKLEDALATLNKTSAKSIDENALKKAQKAFEKLQHEAENTSKAIEKMWLEMTGTQSDILEQQYQDLSAELEKSKAANKNYQRDRERLEIAFAEKRRQLANQEAKERADQIKSISNQYIQMYSAIEQKRLKGSALGIFNIEKSAKDDIKNVSDHFDELTAKYKSATKAQQQAIIDGLNETGIAYKITADGMLDCTEELLTYSTKRWEEAEKDKTEYTSTGASLRADIDQAYNDQSLSRLKQLLTKENALRLNALETQKKMMDTYQNAFLASAKTTTDLVASMYEGIFSGVQSSISELLTGVSSLGEAFSALGETLLRVVADYVAQKIAGALTVSLFESNLLGTKTAQEIAAEETVAGIKTTAIAMETADKLASIGAISAAQIAAEEGLLAAGLTALTAFSVASVAQGAAVAAAWAAAAANVSLASFGANAGPAMAGISSTHALTKALSVPALANGGYATGPTLALIGEGKHDEAVMPMSNWVFSRIAKEISGFLGGGQGNGGVTLNNYGDIHNASDEGRILGGVYVKTRFALMGG